MKLKAFLFKIVLLLCVGFLEIQAQTDSVYVCNVKFKNSKFNNAHAGSGFLLNYNNKIFGITAKHVLFFAKTDSMKTVSFNGELESWTFQSKTNDTIRVKMGSLVNENKDEPLEMPPKGDWLIFEVDSKLPENAVIYSIRETPLKTGEKVSFLGIPYQNKTPIKVEGVFERLTETNNLIVDVPNGNYAGCSGGPVVDKNGKLVGIVSMGYYNQNLKKYIFEPASLDYFKSQLASVRGN